MEDQTWSFFSLREAIQSRLIQVQKLTSLNFKKFIIFDSFFVISVTNNVIKMNFKIERCFGHLSHSRIKGVFLNEVKTQLTLIIGKNI
jgi:hypothetical protein